MYFLCFKHKYNIRNTPEGEGKAVGKGGYEVAVGIENLLMMKKNFAGFRKVCIFAAGLNA